MAKPVMKIVYKDPDGQYAEAAAIWQATRKDGTPMDGLYNLSPVTEARDGQYPAIPLVQALERVANKEGFLNVQLGFGEGGNKLVITEGGGEEGF